MCIRDRLDITLISDSPLLEHDAMYMMQNIEKSRHRQLERKAREDRRRALALQTGTSEEDLRAKENLQAEAREESQKTPEPVKAEPSPEPPVKEKKATKAKAAKKDEKNNDVFDFEEEDEDLF